MPEIMVRGIWIFSIHISMVMLAYSGMFYIDLNTNIYINNSIASYFVIDCHVWKDSLSQGHSFHMHNWIKVELQCFQFWIHFKCHFFYRILISIIYLTFYLFLFTCFIYMQNWYWLQPPIAQLLYIFRIETIILQNLHFLVSLR